MAEVAIKAVEAVFDWRAYLKKEFDLDIPYEEKAEGQDSAAETGKSEAGTAK